ncbi:carboxymuconolactone decarboxylase family protein [Flagellimonas sp.]|uniref:carboxymuconolactone decarboxylase family protein n=1 Tax=Flagellimonas sp. TaxID=2058762 RepID=UPI003BA8B4F0
MKIVLKGMVQGILFLCCFCLMAQQETETPKGLDPKEESIVKIASLTAQGELDRLALELAVGLDNGLSVNEIKEVIVHLYAYGGFPRSIRGLQTFLDVLEDRKNKGITDNWGKEASPIKDTRSKYDRGVETLEELILAKMDGPKPGYQQFSPEIDVFLKEHLFADLFERDVLTYQQRELTTISVIASLGGLDPMLRSHLSISMNMGLTPNELNGFVDLIATTAGEKKAADARGVLKKVLEAR